MSNNQEKAKEEYLKVLSYNGEIEFSYAGSFYHIEPDANKEDSYNIWKFSTPNKDSGEVIATCSPATSVLSAKIFNDKTLLEIEDEITSCVLR